MRESIAAILFASVTSEPPHQWVYPLDSTKGLVAFGATLVHITYRGKQAVRLDQPKKSNNGGLAVLTGLDFKDGTIDFDIAGMPIKNATPDVRGFVGIAFHASPDRQKYECFYLRMTNGRSSDQEQRNHAVQYCSAPEYGWQRLRKEQPFKYEAYKDLEVGAWTHVHIAVSGTEAQFYVGPSSQPCLVVHDLLLGPTRGNVALWVGDQSCAYFSNLKVHAA